MVMSLWPRLFWPTVYYDISDISNQTKTGGKLPLSAIVFFCSLGFKLHNLLTSDIPKINLTTS